MTGYSPTLPGSEAIELGELHPDPESGNKAREGQATDPLALRRQSSTPVVVRKLQQEQLERVRRGLHTIIVTLRELRDRSRLRRGRVSGQQAPGKYIDKRLGALVGIEITVTDLEGKWKMSQNRTHEERQGVASGLESNNADVARVMRRLEDET